MLLGHHRALVSVRTEGITEFERLGFLPEQFQEFVVDAGLDVDTRASGAGLTRTPAAQASPRISLRN